MRLAVAEFSAPWSRSLRLLTTFSVVILLTVAMAGGLLGPRQSWVVRVAMVGAPLAVLLGALVFMVRGYVLTDSGIEVRRLGWSTALPFAGLVAVSGAPQGLRGSLRLFGNGGLFAISGRFRAYATDPERAVLLRYRDGKQVVVTPHDVQHFIVRVRSLANIP